jgi:hypothetical protein
MCKDKTQTKKRKLEQKMKSMMKKAGFNLDSLKREIYSYQFRFVDQPSWKQPFPTMWTHSSNDMKNKDWQLGSPGARE